MNRIRVRAEGRRRIGATTGWAVAAGGVLSALFGVLFAQATPPAAAGEAAPAAPVPATSTPPAPVATAPTPIHHSHALQPPTRAPRSSKATAPHVSSGAS